MNMRRHIWQVWYTIYEVRICTLYICVNAQPPNQPTPYSSPLSIQLHCSVFLLYDLFFFSPHTCTNVRAYLFTVIHPFPWIFNLYTIYVHTFVAIRTFFSATIRFFFFPITNFLFPITCILYAVVMCLIFFQGTIIIQQSKRNDSIRNIRKPPLHTNLHS